MSKLLVVNNPAAKEGGVLTVLKEFLDKISTLSCNRKFLIIVSVEELKKYESSTIEIKVISRQNFKERIIWDNFGLKNYLEENKINPDIFISLQNTGVKIDKNIPQIVYYQQPLSLSDLKWNIFKKNQRLYWLYKNIYPFFIKYHLDKVKKVIVQTKWVRDAFSNKFNYSEDNIILIRPQIKNINIESVNKISKEKFRIFYPATPYIYKNHRIIIEALRVLKKENLEIIKKIECIFTFEKGENLKLDKLIKEYELEDMIKLIGKIPYQKVLEYYKSSDLLVFPSYLETFGLPLIEAQQFNLDILAVDLPYSREVIGKYKRCEFIKHDDIIEWSKEIKSIVQKKVNNEN